MKLVLKNKTINREARIEKLPMKPHPSGRKHAVNVTYNKRNTVYSKDKSKKK